MSHRNKFSLWQKLKRLLTTLVPVADVVDAKSTHQEIHQTDINNEKLNADLNTETGLDNTLNTTVDNETDADIVSTTADDDNLLSTNATDSSNDSTPITDYLKQYLHDKQWHYTYYRPQSSDSQQSHHLSLRMRHKQLECGYLFRIQENNSLLAVYGILPFLIPESHQSAAMLLITQVNYDMLVGNLEMDINDGEIRYKNAIDVEAVGINDDITEHLLQSVIAMTTFAYEIFSDLVNTQDPAEDMSTLLMGLRQQADERTFFLPTQFVQ